MELVLFLLALVIVFLALLPGAGGAASRWLAWLPPLACVALLLQRVVERYRWQLVPLYALTVILFGLGMDAWLGPVSTAVIHKGLTQPFLFMRSQV